MSSFRATIGRRELVRLIAVVTAVFSLALASCGEGGGDKRPYQTLDILEGSGDTVAFSPDGQVLAVGVNMWSDESKKWTALVQLWETRDWKALAELTLGEGIQDSVEEVSVAFSPDGQLLATGASVGKVLVWSTADWKIRQTLDFDGGRVLVTFSPDGKTLAATDRGDTVSFWQVEDWKPLPTISLDPPGASAIAISPDGTLLATGSDDEDVRLWHIPDGKLVMRLRGHTEEINTLAFSPDGETLASGGYDEIVRLWQISDGKSLHTLGASVGDVAFSPDGKTIAAGGVWSVPKLFKVDDGALITKLKGPSDSDGSSPKVFGLDFSPDGKTLAGVIQYSEVWLWSIP